jgi:hypothetical protein
MVVEDWQSGKAKKGAADKARRHQTLYRIGSLMARQLQTPPARAKIFSLLTFMALDDFDDLEKRIQAFRSDEQAVDADSRGHPIFLRFLREACTLVRAEDEHSADFEQVVQRAARTINDAIGIAYGQLEIDFLPSFADSDEFPVLLGPHEDANVFCEWNLDLRDQLIPY